jgi:hypothetical protein
MVVLGLALLAAGLIIAIALTTSGDGDGYDVATPRVAGGLVIEGEGGSEMDSEALNRTEAQVIVGRRATRGVSANYAGANVRVTFTGVAGTDLGDPADLVTRLNANPPQVLQRFPGRVSWAEVDPGPHGGKAACGTVTAELAGRPVTVVTCAWQTRQTFGQLTEVPPTGGNQTLSANAMAELMRRMRADLEPSG